MTNYLELALKYLKLNKKRTMVSVIGTAITAFILFSFLNTFEGTWLLRRDRIREQNDYEIVLITETEEEIEAVISDRYVKSAYVGGYYHLDDGGKYYIENTPYDIDSEDQGDRLPEGVSYIPNATFINTTSPYRMLTLRDYFSETYGLEADVNEDLCYSYFQPYKLGIGTVAVILLISIIIAIMGVGIVRNTIQISTIEQIKDYGNLRCIGATKSQVRYIILCEGLIIETLGILIGCGVSMILSKSLGYLLAPILSTIVNKTVNRGDAHLGPHFLPMIPVFAAFYYDLFFMMRENAKLITGISPVDAIRGNMRVKLPKIKRRSSGLIGKIFGVAGDYAYKNIHRNNMRFLRSTGAIIFGIAILVAALGVYIYNAEGVKNIKKLYGKYPVSAVLETSPTLTREDYIASMPDPDAVKALQEMELIEDTRPVYRDGIMLTDSSYLINKVMNADGNDFYSKAADEDNRYSDVYEYLSSSVELESYNSEEMDYLSHSLIEGTMDVSPRGVIAVRGVMAPTGEEDVIFGAAEEIPEYDFKVGDKIEIIDPAALEEALKQEDTDISVGFADISTDAESGIIKKYERLLAIRDRLIDEGNTIELTVEGVISSNTLYPGNIAFPNFVVPKENFMQLTGLSETDIRGYLFSTKRDIFGYGVSSDDLMSIDMALTAMSNDLVTSPVYLDTGDLYITAQFKLFNRILGFIMAFAIMLTFVNFLNVMNINASSIALRRKEFAQLRAIGISDRDLRRMVLMEGVLQGLLAGVIGGVIGWAAYLGIYKATLIYMFGESRVVLWPVIIALTIITVLVLCLSINMQLRRMNMNLSEDLMASE